VIASAAVKIFSRTTPATDVILQHDSCEQPCEHAGYLFQIKYTEAILSNNTRKLLWFEITKMLIAGLKYIFIVTF